MLQNVIKVLTKYGYLFADGVWITIELSLITVACSSILGSLMAILRRSRLGMVRFITSAYVEIVRGTPLLLQLYFFYFMLPQFLPFLNLSEFACVVIALVFNSIAYVAEIVRAGIDAVDRGQMEAARSLGLNGRQAMVRVILPQAAKNILPALCNEFVSVIKETSLASTFFLGDIMSQYKIINGFTFLIIEPLLIAGIIYFIITFVLSKGIAVLERRMKASD